MPTPTLLRAGTFGIGFIAALRFALARTGNAWDLVRAHLRYVPTIGLSSALALLVAEASERKPLSRLIRPVVPERLTITPSPYNRPLTMRTADTDRAVVRQVLALQEYRKAASMTGVKLIVDCGANIGISAYYFLHHYPESTVIAVEPDERNCELCRGNLQAFGGRAIVVRGAVWPESRPLRITPASRHGGSWSFSVEPASGQTADVDGLTIPAILERAGRAGPIDLLKIDIEGAEFELFQQPAPWLDMVRHIAIELHTPGARAALLSALAGYDYALEESGESTIVKDLVRRSNSTALQG